MKYIPIFQHHDNTVYPPSASAQGNNAFYLEFCNFAGYRPAYCSCLDRVATYQRGEALLSTNNECGRAIKIGACQAAELRKEELGMNKAIYFIDRAKQQEVNDRNLRSIGISIDRTPIEKPSITFGGPTPQGTEATSTFATSGYADAINIAIAKESSKSATQPTSDDVILRNEVSAYLNESENVVANFSKNNKLNLERGLSLEEIAKRMNAGV